jgi:hypothetical protein
LELSYSIKRRLDADLFLLGLIPFHQMVAGLKKTFLLVEKRTPNKPLCFASIRAYYEAVVLVIKKIGISPNPTMKFPALREVKFWCTPASYSGDHSSADYATYLSFPSI